MKKVISSLLALLMLAGTLAVGISAQTFVNDDSFSVGNADASEDGNINGQDAYMIKSYLAGKTYALDNISFDAADMNADGVVNATDAYYLKCLLAGKMSISDFDNGKQIYRLTIGGADISEFTLNVGDSAESNDNSMYAAEIMQRYVEQACGVRPQIVKGAPAGEHAVIFNIVDINSELGQQLGTEGYKYDVTDGMLNVYGTYRGNMYAVYEILENYLGFRFYDDEYTFQYKFRTVDIPEGTSVEVQPKLNFRYCGENVSESVENYYYPSRQNGTQIYSYSDARYGLQYGPQFINAHSFGYYWRMGTGVMPPDDGTKTLEERYVEKYNSGVQQNEFDWQPCASNETSYNTLFNGMLDTMRRIENWGAACYAFTTTAKELVAQGQKTMSFSLCDNEKYCTCRNCNLKANGKLDKKTGEWITPPEGYSGVYVDLANRAARDIQQYYPGMRVHMILYNHDIPTTVRPDKNLIVFYCGQGCNNHYINSGECTNLGQLGKENNIKTAASLKAWGEMCAETGAEMWYWYYGVTYAYLLVSLPCIFNIYYDYKFLYEECNVRGIYYEGQGEGYNFETVKAYMSVKMEWEPDMSYEQYIAYLKEYLYMYYGDGYEEIFEFIEMENTAGDLCGTCFVSNFDRPGDMYSYAYIDEHYEYMRQLLCDALDKADRAEYVDRIEKLIICFDFLGLSSAYNRMYVNGDESSRALYEQRYTDMYNGIKSHGMRIFSDPATYSLPDSIDFTENPMKQFYEIGSRRPGVDPW